MQRYSSLISNTPQHGGDKRPSLVPVARAFWLSFCLFFSMAFLISNGHAEQVSSISPQKDSPLFSPLHLTNTLPQNWGLVGEDWDTYRILQQGEAGLYYQHMEPAFVLAMYADNPADRQRYMEIFVRRDDARRQRLLDANREFILMRKQLFPRQNKFDESFIAMWESISTSTYGQPQLSTGQIERQRIYITIRDCDACLQVVEKRIKRNLPFDLFFLDAQTDTDIQTWARQARIPMDRVDAGLITLNYADIDLASISAEQIPFIVPNIDSE